MTTCGENAPAMCRLTSKHRGSKVRSSVGQLGFAFGTGVTGAKKKKALSWGSAGMRGWMLESGACRIFFVRGEQSFA